MNHMQRLGSEISIKIQPDEDGYTGRECPNSDCEDYFKIVLGTGLKGENLPCHCPYCGHTASSTQFTTKEQLEYAKSVAIQKVIGAIQRDFKSLEFNHKPRGGFGIGISLEVKPGSLHPIRYYREKQLETEVVCSNCTLRYAVYGVFAFCPDCGMHNSLQILSKNLDLTIKMLDMAVTAEAELAERLIQNALEDCISAFDGFGREICRVYASKSTDPVRAEKISFQNLEGTKQNMSAIFTIDLPAALIGNEWKIAVQGFQKRHLLSHTMGVVDEDYIRKTGDTHAIVGRKVAIDIDEVRELVRILGKLAQTISETLARRP